MASETNDNHVAILEEALTRFVDECLQGNRPDVDKFVEQYPQCQDKLKGRLQDLDEIDSLLDSLVRTDESDFPNTMPEPDLVGRRIGSFEIVEMIGKGGMGVVYRAKDTKLDRFVAIKSMPVGLAGNSTARTRFRREAKLLASLNHPNIAAIYDIFEHDEDHTYLVLEHVRGETLSERTAREPFKLEETLLIGQQIAEAVSAAHKNGIVHRDLKPGNIKITPGGRVKVLDFGLAKATATTDKAIETTTTQIGRVMGTPAYMSPEQARGKATDERTDIWSFGCILYQMLTGRLPFEGDTTTDILASILQTDPDWEVLPLHTPENVRILIRRCLEKDLDRRLQDIEEAGIEIRETRSKPVVKPLIPISTKSRRRVMIACMSIIAILSAMALWSRFDHEQIRLVVLPFENLGPAVEEWFADGITDEITTRLVGIHGVSVISRQSAMQYKNKEKSVPQIADDLDVDYMLQGTIQREHPSDPNSSLIIRIQLVKALDDRQIWAQTYVTDMHEVLLQLQSNVVEQVVQALDINLLEPQRHALTSSKTENSLAYEYYLRGNEYFYRRLLDNDFETAIKMYTEAVRSDSRFELAYTQISRSHVFMYWFHHDHSEERLVMAEGAVRKAFQLNPNLPEAHVALGYYYYLGHRKYDLALDQFKIAMKSQPNNSEILAGIGFVERRRGKPEQALPYLEKAFDLNPLFSYMALQIGVTHSSLGNVSEAESYYRQAVFLAPDTPAPYVNLAWLNVRWQGNTEKAREILEEALQNTNVAENSTIVRSLVGFDILDGKYQDALDRIYSKSVDINDMDLNTALQHGFLYRYMDKNEESEKYFTRARFILESRISEDPNDDWAHSTLGVVQAALGHRDKAIFEGRRAVELLPLSKDAMEGSIRIKNLAVIYAMVGEHDLAFDQLESIKRPIAGGYRMGGNVSVTQLRFHPDWKALRSHPRFEGLLDSTK